jgi:hypothetical protein
MASQQLSRRFTLSVPLTLVAALAAAGARPAMAQTPSTLVGTDWVGTVRCDIKATAQGYLHEERQTWTLNGGAPTTQGAFLVFPATWTVTGQGTHDRTGQTSRRVAQWTAAVPGPNAPVNAPIAFMAAPVTGQINVQLWHSQLSRQGGYTGTDQYINGGVPQAPGRLVATLYEWQFPKIVADPKSTRISGSTTYEVKAQVGPLQPLSEAQVTIACAWELGRGTANPLPGSPTTPDPSSGSTSSNTPPANPPGSTTNPNAPGSTTTPGATTPAPGGTTTAPSTTAARILSIDKTTFEQGAFNTVVVLTGSSTHWSQTKPVVTVEPGVGYQIDTVQAESDTSLYVALPIQYSAATGPRSITVRTGNEVVTLPNAFTITPRAKPVLSGIAPATGKQGDQTVSIAITGQNTRWAQNTTTFWIGLPTDGSNPNAPVPPQYVTTQSLTVHSATSATAVVNIAPNAVVGPYWVVVGPAGPDGLMNTTGFTVTSAPTSSSNPPSASTSASNPTSGAPTGTSVTTGPVTAPTAPNNSLPGRTSGGGLTAIPATGSTPTTPATPVDPANFIATQTADGTVRLEWNAVPGAGSYLLGGPGTNVGVTVNGTSYTVTGIAPGTHSWTVATNYNPGGVLTTSDKWSKATATVVNRSARYRIVLNGFRVNSETNAGTFGEHNAVFAAAAVEVLDRQNNFAVARDAAVVRSLVHGDVGRDPTRVRGGSASSTGGFLPGDLFPAGQNPASLSLSPSTTTFPLLLWEGQLTDGLEAVVVRPTLWVMNSRLDVFNRWERLATSFVPAGAVNGVAKTARDLIMDTVRDRAGRGDLSPFRNESRVLFSCFSDVIPTVESEQCGPGWSHRPIGLRPSPGVSQYNGWLDLAVVVTREGIEKALSSSAQIGGAGNGVIPIALVDNGSNWGGNYDLYLKVERVP